MRLQLAERFHWTYDYIDTLSLGTIDDIFESIDGRDKAAAYFRRKHEKARQQANTGKGKRR